MSVIKGVHSYGDPTAFLGESEESIPVGQGLKTGVLLAPPTPHHSSRCPWDHPLRDDSDPSHLIHRGTVYKIVSKKLLIVKIVFEKS